MIIPDGCYMGLHIQDVPQTHLRWRLKNNRTPDKETRTIIKDELRRRRVGRKSLRQLRKMLDTPAASDA